MVEFQGETAVHNLFLDFIPVLSERMLPGLAHGESIMWFRGFNYLEFVRVAFELFGLEIVLSGGVDNAIFLELGGIEVGEEAIRAIFFIELDRALILFIHS